MKTPHPAGQHLNSVALPVIAASAPSVAITKVPEPSFAWMQYGGSYFTGFAAMVAAGIAAHVALRSIKTTRDNLTEQLNLQRELSANTSRASVVSANRQRWIDALRDDLAELIAADYILADDVKLEEHELSEVDLAKHQERVEDASQRRRLMYRRIQLRLNPEKPHHDELLQAVRIVMRASGPAHPKAARKLTNTAQIFLRREWLRVKAEASGIDPLSPTT
jgi:hypothetical protein